MVCAVIASASYLTIATKLGMPVSTTHLTESQIPGVIVGAGALWGIIMGIFLCPWLYRVVIKEDWPAQVLPHSHGSPPAPPRRGASAPGRF